MEAAFKKKQRNINPKNARAKKKKKHFKNKLCEMSCGHFLCLSCGSRLISHSEFSLLHISFKILLSPVAMEEKRDFANPSSECDLQAEHAGIRGSIAENELP